MAPSAQANSTVAPWDRQDVPALLTLDRIDEDLFRNRFNQTNINAAPYGGQVLGQALAAAAATVRGKAVHSLHCYFLRSGDASRPIDFLVERTRDGGRFATRHVRAVQGDEVLLHMNCSFRERQSGYLHQPVPAAVSPPEDLPDLTDIALRHDGTLGEYAERIMVRGPIEVRPVSLEGLRHQPGLTRRQYWIRVPSARTDDPAMQLCVLAYLSDHWLAGVALIPHRAPSPGSDIFITSIDHSLWVHNPPSRMDDWLLYDTESPVAAGGTTLARGLLFDRAGTLIASVCQETLQVPRR